MESKREAEGFLDSCGARYSSQLSFKIRAAPKFFHTPELVYESILNAPTIFKALRSRNPRTKKSEKLYVIKGLTFDGLDIYTKGKIIRKEGIDVFYVLISSKRSTDI